MDQLAQRLGVLRPKRFNAISENITALQAAYNWVNAQSKREGFGRVISRLKNER
jgi:hypothetical protein